MPLAVVHSFAQRFDTFSTAMLFRKQSMAAGEIMGSLNDSQKPEIFSNRLRFDIRREERRVYGDRDFFSNEERPHTEDKKRRRDSSSRRVICTTSDTPRPPRARFGGEFFNCATHALRTRRVRATVALSLKIQI